jgi:hypothetical protein
VGYLGESGHGGRAYASIANCYALGNVIADNPNSSPAAKVYAGGLVGYVDIAYISGSPGSGSVSKSFATGSVTAKNASSSAGVWAGGVAGYVYSHTLQYNAAFGGSVTEIGPGTKKSGRIYGALSAGTSDNNYAVDNTRVYTAATYAATPSYTTPSSTVASSAHGKGTPSADFRNQVFWSADIGLGSEWVLSSVWSKGYPLLVGVGGQ